MWPPPLPDYSDEGYDWIARLSGGWYVVASWGSDGWDLGSWPYVIVAHYNGDRHDNPGIFALAVYVEGDIVVSDFATRDERDQATNKTALFYWRNADHPSSAPRSLDDPRLGPYRG